MQDATFSVSRHFGHGTLWTQDMSRNIGTYKHFGIKEDNSATSNTVPSHGQVEGCACVMRNYVN